MVLTHEACAGINCQVGHPAKIRAAEPRKQKHDRRDALAAASLVVRPSRTESLGLVYLEAWANAKPVIAADIAVTRELIEPGCDGLLVPFGDAHALAAPIRQVLEHPRESEKMGLQGQQKVQSRFSWDAVLERIHPYFLKRVDN